MVRLRQYQVAAIEGLRAVVRSGKRSALLVLPTGAGKTVVFVEIAKAAAAKGNSTLILVHRRELITQASNKLKAIGVDHGIIAAGFPPTYSQIQIASVQTLVRRLDKIKIDPALVIIDEAHHAVAGSWDKILNHFSGAIHIGVTATPCRLSGEGLGLRFSALVSGPSVAELVESGFLSPHRVFAPPVLADLSKVKTRAGDYANDQLSEAMDRPTITGSAVHTFRLRADGLPAIAFCCSVAHAKSVCQSFQSAGYRARLVTGDMPMEERDDAISGLADGRTQILCSVDVVSEGTDVPAVSCAILLRPTQSESLYLQQVGRILRPQAGKIAIVLDHVGSTVRHGFVDDLRDWSLDSKKRKRNDEPAPSVRQCPQCFAAFKPQPVCPCCGFIFPVKPKRQLTQREGELKEMRRQDAIERREKRKEQGRARTLPELLALAKRKGYKPGWAYKIFYGRRH